MKEMQLCKNCKHSPNAFVRFIFSSSMWGCGKEVRYSKLDGKPTAIESCEHKRIFAKDPNICPDYESRK